MSDITKPTGLALLRVPFEARLISKLPKPSKAQTEALRANFKLGQRCAICGGWHQPDVVHLDYVGHAALTDRLLDADPAWSWEPLALHEGLPAIDPLGGLWIKLTVCGVTRLGYGDAQGKEGPNAIKECIGDALRNAAMRFGAALDLWHKGDLHGDDEGEPKKTGASPKDSSKGAGAISGPRVILDDLPEDWKAWLSDFARDVTNTFASSGAVAAQALIDDVTAKEQLGPQHRAGLEALLDSKCRSALKALPRAANQVTQ